MKKYLKINILFLAVLLFFTVTVNTISADSGDRLKGYGWSDGIGWVSFNCYNDDSCSTSNYGVDIDMTAASVENMSGYAWSDSVGWISFGYCHIDNGCTGPTYDETTGKMSGQVMVLSGLTDTNDGWDGLINLSDFSGAHPYGPVVSGGEVSDYSWGSEVVGWLSFNCINNANCGNSDYKVTIDAFKFNFTADKGLSEDDKALYGSNVLLSWQTIGNVTSCTPTNGSGTGWTTDDLPRGLGQPTTSTFLVSNITADTDFTLTCSGPGGSIQRDLHIFVKPPPPTVVLGADDTNIGYNTSTNLNWSTANVDSCTLSGPVNFTPAQSVSTGSNQSASTGNLTNYANYYEIECTPSNLAEYPDNVTSSVTVNVEKLIVDFSANSNPIPYNDRFKLNWDTEFANACSVHTSTTPELSGSGGGLTSNFEGSVDHNDGNHEFTSLPQDTEGRTYQVSIHCDGSNGQTFDDSLLLRVGKNPLFIEN